jgi:dynamin GTPase
MALLQQAMKRIVGVSIENIKGVRPGLFTPDKAFDRVIQTQIAQLEHPIMLVSDGGVDNFDNFISACRSGMR